MPSSRFDILSSFLRKRYKLVLVAWVIALVAFGSQVPTFFGAVNYNVAGSNFGGPTNAESQLAQNILNVQFPSASNSSGNGIIVVLQNSQMYSDGVQSALVNLNRTLAADPTLAASFTGMASLYSTEYSFLTEVVPPLLPQVAQLNTSVASVDSGAHQLYGTNLLLVEEVAGINQSAQLVYGVPSGFVQAWSSALPSCGGSAYCADSAVGQTYASRLASGPNPQAVAYFQTFLGYWNSSFASQPDVANPSPVVREQAAVKQAVADFAAQPQLPAQESQTLSLVASALNATSFFRTDAIGNATVAALSSQVPPELTASLGISLNGLVAGLISLGPSPSNSSVQAFTLQLFTKSVSGSFPASAGLSASQLVERAYALGSSPDSNSTWDLASSLVANGTAASFAASPLFTVRVAPLAQVLGSFSRGYGSSQIRSVLEEVITGTNYLQYPLVLSKSLTRNFISPDNGTMIAVYNFLVSPSDKMIAAFRSDVSSSTIPSLGTYYVTGGPVLTSDISKIFGPVVGVTVVPGVLASLAIVGVLLLAPLAAIVPVLVGGVAIAIALPLIYFGVVDVGHGTLTFLTPSLTILLVLGLAVDYSVLQLRRTREERAKGSSTGESVAISVRWAGQAVLTAGITVVVAYVVMAVANVPLFSGVGTAIAIAVSILIAAALTLLPSLELALKDRLFWPGLRSRKEVRARKKSRVMRLSEQTLKRKMVIVAVVAALAMGAFYVTLETPSGANILKLFPDFPSNHGLTVITDNLGSATITPTVIVVTTGSPILYGDDQFNQTLMNRLEAISSAASSVPGVVSVSGPTRPYGSPFNYIGVQEMPQPEKSQYIGGMLADIGKNNQTAQILVGLQSDSQSQQAIDTLLQVEAAVGKLGSASGVSVYYGGTTQSTYDNQSFLNGILPEVVVVLAAAIYVILLIQLRSVFTPIRLVLTILCSVAFSLALLSIIFFYTLDLPILDFAPLFVVVTMLGVGIDYDIFFVTRIREEALKGEPDDVAIKTALDKTWVTIFGLGLVLSTVFASLVATDIALLQEIGFVVAAAVVIDVGAVILFFVPSLMAIAERFNWWPSKLAERELKAQPEEQE
ncbi:MAG: MMPL family transporter [Nitrososphaerota archaeon]|nr:MMPL family transporter [Nitrososphaerota archaeon]